MGYIRYTCKVRVSATAERALLAEWGRWVWNAKVEAQRQDTACKWAKAVVRGFDQLAVEDFHPKFLAKSPACRCQ